MKSVRGSVWSSSQFRTAQGLTCTIGDHARSELIAAAHVAEAIQYRKLDRAF